MRIDRYAKDPVAFIDDLVRKNELGQPFRLLDHQRKILHLAFSFNSSGRLPYDTIIYSCVKKSGKTTTNAAVTLWWAFTQEAPNESKLFGHKTVDSITVQRTDSMKAVADMARRIARRCLGIDVQVRFAKWEGVAAQYDGAMRQGDARVADPLLTFNVKVLGEGFFNPPLNGLPTGVVVLPQEPGDASEGLLPSG